MTFILPNLKSVFCIQNYCIRYSYVLYLIIPLIIILFFVIRKDYVKFKSTTKQKQYRLSRQRIRRLLIFSRALIFTFLLIAIASPFVFQDKISPGEPGLLILVDNSTSFDIFDQSVATELFKKLKEKITVELRSIASRFLLH